MKTITISLYNRPEYTKQLLEHLDRCSGIDEYKIFITCDPGNLEVQKLASEFRPNQTVATVNHIRVGCNTNIFKSIAVGFAHSDYNIHFEDDTIPGKDCLMYFEWANKQYRDNPNIFTVSAYVNSNNITEHYIPKSTEVDGVSVRSWFTPWGWATWKDRFLEMKDNWDFTFRNGSWDCTVNHVVRVGRFEAFPLVSRTQNIGAENSTHVPSPEWHALHHYNEYWIETLNDYPSDFREVE